MVKTWSPEANEKRSRALRGMPKSPEHRAAMAASKLVHTMGRYPEQAYNEVYDLCLKRIRANEDVDAELEQLERRYREK